jgi:hypothetical protein
MKTVRQFFAFFILSIMVFILLATCASTPEKSAKEKYFSAVNSKLLMEQYFCIINTDVTFVTQIGGKLVPDDSILFHGNRFISAGYYRFNVQYREGHRYSDIVTMHYDFEPGKSYYVDYKISEANISNSKNSIGLIRFFVKEVTDFDIDPFAKAKTDKEYLTEYLKFSELNPNYLEGTWKFEKNFPQLGVDLTFADNRFTVVLLRGMLNQKTIAEGRYYFNEETIILIYEKKQNRLFNSREAIYYGLNNDVLNIKKWRYGIDINLKGEYFKKE